MLFSLSADSVIIDKNSDVKVLGKWILQKVLNI